MSEGAVRVIEPLDGPLDAVVWVPGSKSITNRALVCAALAEGTSTLTGALQADDTEAMVDCLQRLGIDVVADWAAETIVAAGCAGQIPAAEATLDCRLSGTTSRFILPVAALGGGRYVVDGAAPLRRRPMGPALEALRALGVEVEEQGDAGHLPVVVHGPIPADGSAVVPADASSQFLSGLMLVAPARGLRVEASAVVDVVSQPYLDMTARVAALFGPEDDEGYRGTDVAIEPDASAASYFFAAAALCGGSVTVEGLGTRSIQGDVAFVDVLARMGADVEKADDHITVTGTGTLRGGVFDFTDISDTAQTLAAIAPFADGPVSVTGIGFIRGKETDRIGAVVTELQRLGVQAEEKPDGFVVHPGTPQPGTVQTYDDHRMAMSFAVLGLRVPGIAIADPEVVGKTFPRFWEVLDGLRV